MDRAIVILGPTASGKTALALELSKHYKIEIISLDSALIYKDMDIGTAKPSKEELAMVPHHLIDICDPSQSYSAASFRSDCIRLVREISSRNAVAVICGGTMMYYKALIDGLSPLPETEPKVRQKIAKEAEVLGWSAMHAKLESIDNKTFLKLNPNDRQRISRALEVYEMTGRAMSSFFDDKKECCPFERVEFVLLPFDDDRTALRELIRRRFYKMVEDGLVDEVRALWNRGDLDLSMPSMRCVGYRQVVGYLEGEYSLDEAAELVVNATSHLAKHQMTWLRGSLSSDTDAVNIKNSTLLARRRLNIGEASNLKIVLDTLKQYF